MPPSACTNVGASGGSQSQPSKVYFMPQPLEDAKDAKQIFQVDSPLYYPPLTADDYIDPLFTPSTPPIDFGPTESPKPMQPILPLVNRRLFNVGKSLLPQAGINGWSWRKIGIRIATGIGVVVALLLGLAVMFALGDFLARTIGY